MTNISIDRVEAATNKISKYHVRLEFSAGELVHEGEIDDENQMYHLQIFKENRQLAELKRMKDATYGKIPDSGKWDHIEAPEEFPTYLRSAVMMLKKGTITSVEEQDLMLKAGVVLEDIPPLRDPTAFFKSIYKKLNIKNEKFLNKMIELGKSMTISTQFWIRKNDYQISRISTQVAMPNRKSEMVITFTDSTSKIMPIKAEDITTTQRKISSLMLRIPSFGGWPGNAHREWTEKSLDLVRIIDEKTGCKDYSEVYESLIIPFIPWLDPLLTVKDFVKFLMVYGAASEDNEHGFDSFYIDWFGGVDPDPGKKVRDYCHFGGEDKGLEGHWYHKIVRENTPAPYLGERGYYSARDWGYGGDRVKPEHNRMTFTEAITQYNSYTPDGARNAYLVLGHVLHLLQDVGAPDHANLAPHPMSSKTEREAYADVCKLVAAEAAIAGCAACSLFCPLCAASAAIIAASACWLSIDEEEVGYEYLVRELWMTDKKRISDLDNEIKDSQYLLAMVQRDYDSYFKEVSGMSKMIASFGGFISPLGCSYLTLSYDPAGLDPEIDKDDPEERDPYLNLTDQIYPWIICLGAGFIRYFYEIANHPPYVKSVEITRIPARQTADWFSKLGSLKRVYNAYWEDKYDKNGVPRVILREKVHSLDVPLNAHNHAYISIKFGPRILSRGKTMRDLKLTMSPDFDGSTPFDITLRLGEKIDDEIYYWGEFDCPVHPLNKEYSMTMEISGYDESAHLATRDPKGDELQSNPAKIAIVDSNDRSLNFKDYEPGIDKNHSIRINPALNSMRKAAEENGFSDPISLKQISDKLALGKDSNSLQALLNNS
jgi:hypothetical protein